MRHSRSYRVISEFHFCIFAVSLFHVSLPGKTEKSAKPIASRLCGYKKRPRNRLSQRTVHIAWGLSFGGSWWIRTTEALSSRFTVCPHWPLGKAPIFSLWPPCLPATYVIIAEGFSKCKPFFDFFCDFFKKARFHHSIEQKLFLTYSCSKRTFIIAV